MVYHGYNIADDYGSTSSSLISVTKSALKKRTHDETQARRVQAQQHKLKCQFSLERTTIHPIECLEDLSDEDIRRVWYSQADLDATRMSMIPIINDLEMGQFVEETDEQTARGLECHTETGRALCDANRRASIESVEREISRQVELYSNDDSISSCSSDEFSAQSFLDAERIRRVYKKTGDPCLVVAHSRALEDQEAASDYYMERVVVSPSKPMRKTMSCKERQLVNQARTGRLADGHDRRCTSKDNTLDTSLSDLLDALDDSFRTESTSNRGASCSSLGNKLESGFTFPSSSFEVSCFDDLYSFGTVSSETE